MRKSRNHSRESNKSKVISKKNTILLASVNQDLIGKIVQFGDDLCYYNIAIILFRPYVYLSDKHKVGLGYYRGLWYGTNPLDYNSYGKFWSYKMDDDYVVIGSWKDKHLIRLLS